MSKVNELLHESVLKARTNTDAFPCMPILELAGDIRVLVENHLGILEYGLDKIVVKVNYGKICICGEGLTMAKMTDQQLVILGKINTVSLVR